MKIFKTILILIATTCIGLAGYAYFKNKDTFENPSNDIYYLFIASNIKMQLQPSYEIGRSNTGTLVLDITIENISSESVWLQAYQIKLIDYNENLYEPTLDISSHFNTFRSIQKINPRVKKQFSLIYEVPIDEIYYLSSDILKAEGTQILVDKIFNVEYKYNSFESMSKLRNSPKYNNKFK